ncbi:MAG: type II secretion system ATPase GspE [Proteobacteria bacterium]|nr:type II secretion system protein GspE [Pseudomonadota bacterium]NOG58879.1 type II secretion system ATPase GspE [Pseudomonadota bacterium]
MTLPIHHHFNSKIEHNDIVQFLLSEDKIGADDLTRAIELQDEKGTSLGILLNQLGLISDKDLASLFNKITSLTILQDNDLPAAPIFEDSLPSKFLKEYFVVPIEQLEDSLVVAMADPTDEYTLQAIKLATSKNVIPKIASISQIESVLERLYGDGQTKLADIVEEIDIDPNESDTDSIERLKDLAAEAPVIRLVSLIINHAVESRASDIHIEPFDNRLKIRYRIDGVLQEAEAPPARSTAAVISRVKIMAKMNIAERRLPQDGRIQIKTQGKLIDLRVSTVPTMHGESLVMRILDKEQVNLDFDILGFSKEISAQFQDILKLPHGIILVTGPTGSGKTTTLYTALDKLNTPDKKILTVEDPVEYQLEGVNQIQVKSKIGLDFADALRSIVRQDPDVIMIGEMRDLETAKIAVQSALTGHLVFSTLHTNDAGSSITRLLDMGVEDYLLSSTLNGILSQRLVRTLCKECRKQYAPLPELIEELNLCQYNSNPEISLYEASGCSACIDSGYVGRSVITELLIISESIRRLILSHADGTTLQKEAVDNGMDTMQIEGIKKALAGITTIEDVMRVTRE